MIENGVFFFWHLSLQEIKRVYFYKNQNLGLFGGWVLKSKAQWLVNFISCKWVALFLSSEVINKHKTDC